jgi:hypothetical protein
LKSTCQLDRDVPPERLYIAKSLKYPKFVLDKKMCPKARYQKPKYQSEKSTDEITWIKVKITNFFFTFAKLIDFVNLIILYIPQNKMSSKILNVFFAVFI